MVHPKLDNVRVLFREDAKTATLFRMVKGKGQYESLTREQVLHLIESAAEALRKIIQSEKDQP